MTVRLEVDGSANGDEIKGRDMVIVAIVVVQGNFEALKRENWAGGE